jgi:hypothetical protein
MAIPYALAGRLALKRNFNPNRQWLGYNVGSPFLYRYRAIGVIFRVHGT